MVQIFERKKSYLTYFHGNYHFNYIGFRSRILVFVLLYVCVFLFLEVA
jgi:hypothetical protein